MTRTAFLLTLLSLLCPLSLSYAQEATNEAEYPAPERFEKAIKSFEAQDSKRPPAEGAIVCIGSSSMRGWHKNIHKDLAPLTLIPRGFGGSHMNDVLHYADRIVLPYRPRAIVLYEGDNDIKHGISPAQIAETFRRFVDKVHSQLPECRIYVLSIKLSIARWELWPRMQAANSLLQALCQENKQLVYVDIASGMLNDEATPKTDIFKKDKLHMTRAGYIIWRDALRPILLDSELQYEQSTQTK